MENITKESAKSFFSSELEKHLDLYLDSSNEIDTTLLAENAQYHFRCMTDEGQSKIEEQIFDWASEYTSSIKDKFKF